jgi:hypothetical protein
MGLAAQELPLLGRLPKLGRDWSLQQQDAKQKGAFEYAWATFTNSKTGDRISFAADKYNGANRSAGSDPTRSTAISMFPGGLPRDMVEQPSRWQIMDTIRFGVVMLGTGATANQPNVTAEALEYSYVYEHDARSAPNRLAHGYALAFGDTCVFVQHTSTHVNTSDAARDAAVSFLQNHSASRPKQ